MGAAFKSRVHLHCVLEEERDVVEDVSKAFLSSRLTGVLPGSALGAGVQHAGAAWREGLIHNLSPRVKTINWCVACCFCPTLLRPLIRFAVSESCWIGLGPVAFTFVQKQKLNLFKSSSNRLNCLGSQLGKRLWYCPPPLKYDEIYFSHGQRR